MFSPSSISSSVVAPRLRDSMTGEFVSPELGNEDSDGEDMEDDGEPHVSLRAVWVAKDLHSATGNKAWRYSLNFGRSFSSLAPRRSRIISMSSTGTRSSRICLTNSATTWRIINCPAAHLPARIFIASRIGGSVKKRQ